MSASVLEKYVLLRDVTPPQFVENAQQTPKPDAHDPESSMVSMRIRGLLGIIFENVQCYSLKKTL